MTEESKADLEERFIELRAEGRSYADIAVALDKSKPTLIAWSRKLSVEIQNARNLRLDALFERFAIAKEKRVEVFGKRLEAILAELDKRDLSELKTADLLTLALKYGDHLREEHIPLKLQFVEEELDLDAYKTIRTWEG